ncbi:MAG TPA: PA0069 family radical SAM protein [Opitutaceae bacterium]|nr:PA0069 family radical SAM protein [Opitutaceae bacterium]
MKSVVGRGPLINPPNRFEQIHLAPDPDAADEVDGEEQLSPRTQFFHDSSESILTYNDSPDVGFDVSVNAYRGCEHGCAYCYARPFHNYLGFSSGIDFETKIMVKLRAAELLRNELAAPKWRPQMVAMSGVTDCYQPAERHFKLTRACLEVFAEFRNPVGIVTKNFLVTRDLDLLTQLNERGCASVTVTVTSLDSELSAKLEPRAALPAQRLRAIRMLADAGIPVSVLIAPVVPGLTDHEISGILEAAVEAGARRAGYVVLRLPHSVKDVFGAWLDTHVPTKKERVLSRVRELRNGALNVAEFGTRMRGEGIFAEQIRQLFTIQCRRLGLNRETSELSTANFRRPGGVQLGFEGLE